MGQGRGKGPGAEGQEAVHAAQAGLTGATAGAEVGDQLEILTLAAKDGAIADESAVVTL